VRRRRSSLAEIDAAAVVVVAAAAVAAQALSSTLLLPADSGSGSDPGMTVGKLVLAEVGYINPECFVCLLSQSAAVTADMFAAGIADRIPVAVAAAVAAEAEAELLDSCMTVVDFEPAGFG